VSGSDLSPDVRARILAVARREPAASRAEGSRRRARVVTVGVLAWFVVLLAIDRPGLRGREVLPMVALSGLWLLIGAAAAWLGIARGRSMLGRGRAERLAVVVLTPLALLGSALAVRALVPPLPVDVTGLSTHLLCVLGTSLFAVGPLFAAILLWRASDPIAPGWAGAAIGAAAGAWGALGIELHCGHTAVLHVVLGHVLPVVLLSAAGAAIGHWAVAIRSESG
jgi:hypothetical protein